MIRYAWMQKDGRILYLTNKDGILGDKISVPLDYQNPIFVNIIKRIQHPRIFTLNHYNVKLYYSNGTILEGWISDIMFPIKLINELELFDGRFNH